MAAKLRQTIHIRFRYRSTQIFVSLPLNKNFGYARCYAKCCSASLRLFCITRALGSSRSAPCCSASLRNTSHNSCLCEMPVRKLRFAPFSSGHFASSARVIGNFLSLNALIWKILYYDNLKIGIMKRFITCMLKG